MISNCGHDERWSYTGGAAGDNNGTEWQLVGWYSYPWNVMLRYPDAKVRNWMGDQATAAAKNNNIGYDQWQRQTFWTNLADSDYDAAKITVKCEADCSSGVLAIAKAAGYKFNIEALKKINQNGYTGNEEAILKAAGFVAHRESKYLTSGEYLDNGDVLLNTQNHTAFNVTRGSKCDASAVSAPIAKPAPSDSNKKSIEQVAREVIGGKWGNGEERIRRLKEAGYDANAVQKKVNDLLLCPNTIEYVVKPGDTLSGIAEKYGVTYQQLARDNGIKDPNIISVGQKIAIKR